MKEARKAARLTQEEAAERLGVGRTTYLRMEKVPDTVTIGQAKRFCELTGTTVEEVFLRGME